MSFFGDVVSTGGSMFGIGGGDDGGGTGMFDGTELVDTVKNAGEDKNSDALLVMSNNSKETAEAQLNAQAMNMTQAAADREMKNAADLELALSNFDTKMQTSKLDYFQAMKREADHHTEKLASISADIPSPTE